MKRTELQKLVDTLAEDLAAERVAHANIKALLRGRAEEGVRFADMVQQRDALLAAVKHAAKYATTDYDRHLYAAALAKVTPN